MSEIDRPRLEGSVAVRGGRRLSFAEFGHPRGAAIVWMHGTPGARRQIPIEARAFAEEHDLRIIGVDRPGIGSSTPHLYPNILDWTGDLVELCDVLDIDTLRRDRPLRRWSLRAGGGRGAARPGARRRACSGEWRPTKGPDAIAGGLVSLAPYAAPLLSLARVPLGFVLAQFIRLVRPIAGPIIDGYAAVQPRGDKELLARPEFRAMFLDDLLNGARFQVSAPLSDVILFTRHWGFEAADVQVPVHWWHGDSDHIIPHAHGVHMAERLPHARFTTDRRGVPPRRARGRHRGADPADGARTTLDSPVIWDISDTPKRPFRSVWLARGPPVGHNGLTSSHVHHESHGP